jgi:hypothetical protein
MDCEELEYYELEALINEHYRSQRQYNFVADVECGNGTSHKYVVEKEQLLSYDLTRLAQFASGERTTYVTRILLTDLCNRDILPAGTYIIRVSW